MSRPIPKKRLTQSVTYQKFSDAGSENSWAAAVTVKYVRYEENYKLIRDDKGNILKGLTLLVYDNVTSLPTGIIFGAEDKVAVNGKTLKVVAPANLETLETHHQEVLLQ